MYVREPCGLGPSTSLLISWRCPGAPRPPGAGTASAGRARARGGPASGPAFRGSAAAAGAQLQPESGVSPEKSRKRGDRSGPCGPLGEEVRVPGPGERAATSSARRNAAGTERALAERCSEDPSRHRLRPGTGASERGGGFSTDLLSRSFPHGRRPPRSSALGVASATPWKKLEAPEGFSAGAAERLPVICRGWPGPSAEGQGAGAPWVGTE